MLTPTQKRVLDAITEHVDRNGYAPTYAEVQLKTGLRSRSNVHAHVLALEEKGYIKRLPGRARCIEVVRRSDEEAPANGWQPIETAPKDDAEELLLIVRRRGAPIRTIGYWNDLYERWYDRVNREIPAMQDVTHWKPLPAPPAFPS